MIVILAAPGHHIPHNVADALGWAVVIVIIAALVLAGARILGAGR